MSAWGYVQTEQLYPLKWIIAWSELGGNKDVNTLAEYVYRSEEQGKLDWEGEPHP